MAAPEVEAPSWENDAECAAEGLDANMWWPERGQDAWPAKLICAQCPVRLQCLDAAVTRRETEGIWGGAGGDLLRGLRRAHTQRPHEQLLVDGCDCPWCTSVSEHLEKLKIQTDVHRLRAAAAETRAKARARVGDHATVVQLRAEAAAMEAQASRLRSTSGPVMARFGPGARHGLRVTYNRGCRCEACCFTPPFDKMRKALRLRQAA